MQRFWWVNHSPTADREVAGGYLWSPRTERGGGRSPFYDNMRRAGPGDLVLSYVRKRIRHLGRAADFAFAAPSPDPEEPRPGWQLPVNWAALEPPVSPQAIIAELGPLLPERYSPISPVTGLGRQKAYLCELSAAAATVVLDRARWEAARLDGPGEVFPRAAAWVDDRLEAAVTADPGLDATQKQALVTARRGQGIFRENVRALEPFCRVTGVSNPWLLIASHIKPWRDCDSAAERLDGANGLMLTPDVDLLFDRGFLSFADDGTALVSPRLDAADLGRMGLGDLAGRDRRPFRPRQAAYLAWHRRWVFLT